MCPVNGIRDLVQWRCSRDWSNEFVWGLGQGSGFAYLRFDKADPPRQVYTGIATSRQHRVLAHLFEAGFTEIENRTFSFSWGKACQAVDQKTPPLLGPLDMYYLHFYPDIYHKRHIPIHYVLLVWYDAENAYVQDTGFDDVQVLPLEELKLAWDVNVPGLGKKNRLAVIDIPRDLPPSAALVRKAIAGACQSMLQPPVSMLGIPAMKKVAREIAFWPEEFGKHRTDSCLRQVCTYLNSPPDADGTHPTAGRDLYITFLEEAGAAVGLDFSEAVALLRQSIAVAPGLVEAIRRDDLREAAVCFERMAEVETAAYTTLRKIIGFDPISNES